MTAMRGALVIVGLTAVAACTPAGPPSGRAPAQPLPPAAGELPRAEPSVRVGVLVDAPEVEVSAPEGFEVVVGGAAVARAGAGQAWRFRAAGAGIEALDDAGAPAGRWDGVVTVRPSGAGPLTLGERPYMGGALLRRTEGGVTAVNVLGLEDYLLGVVPHELGRRPPSEIEAVKAQAVAARTYAVGHMGRREAQGFDFFATVSDQVYRGLEVRDSVAERAVRETRGQIVAWQGAPILAYYSSTCGGRTSAIHEVWRSAPLPYLRSIADVDPATGEAWCAFSNRFRWEETWRGAELTRILGRTLAQHSGRAVPAGGVQRAEVRSRTTSERVDTLLLVVGGQEFVVRGDSTRWVLRPDSADGRILNSARFDLAAEHDEAGHISSLTARGGGWGHGIGMCQVGAIGRARGGQSHRQILTAYYQGTDILTLY